VIECGAGPGRGRVAGQAVLRQPGGYVVWIGGPLIILPVTAGTRRRSARIPAARVALQTRGSRMRASQCEPRARVVIECGAGPGRGRVAGQAVLRQPGGYVVWIGGPLIILQVTAGTRRRSARKAPAQVALRAGRLRVCSV
jgi:hypothetical protein